MKITKSYTIEDTVARDVKELAEKQERSESSVVNRILRDFIENDKKEVQDNGKRDSKN